jgi:lipoprotein-anchoring transpeptidase ErfK/SrfK
MFKHWSLPLAAALALTASPGHAQQSNLGGGFIEFLVTGNAGGGARYAPQPAQPQRAPAPGYYPSANGASYYADPLVSAARPDVGVVRRAIPRPAYATAPGAIPDSSFVPTPVPTEPVRPQRSTDVAYAPMPKVQGFEGKYEKQVVDYDRGHAAGTIVIDTPNKFLYLVQGDGKALRYGIGVGRPGFEWAGVKHITRKAEWPSWTPPKEMLKRRPDLPRFMAGGEDNPLGARALYLGSSLYRIHGTNEPSTIGQAVSSGCIRMRNSDVIDLYSRVRVGTKVVVM